MALIANNSQAMAMAAHPPCCKYIDSDFAQAAHCLDPTQDGRNYNRVLLYYDGMAHYGSKPQVPTEDAMMMCSFPKIEV